MINFIQGDIFDVACEHFISSGNVLLNMSGGVNGGLLERYGKSLQVELHGVFNHEKNKFVDPGFVYRFRAQVGNYKTVVYAVGIDGWYESTQDLIVKTVMQSIKLINPYPGSRIVMPAIGTGYGKLPKREFGMAVRKVYVPENVTLTVVEKSDDGLQSIIEGYNSIIEHGT